MRAAELTTAVDALTQKVISLESQQNHLRASIDDLVDREHKCQEVVETVRRQNAELMDILKGNEPKS